MAQGDPSVEEIACFGARGDGKTQGVLGGMIAHAEAHHAAGFPLPVKWLGAADTFASHVSKTHDSLREPMWRGMWRLRDGGRQAQFVSAGTPLVDLRLFGVEDQAGMDRLRAGCHALWFEEPAPTSVLVQSSGLSETAWALGITSCRLPSHRHPKVMTLNYPDEEHWSAQRFYFKPQSGTQCFRVPPAELANEAQRETWRRALVNRPDLLRRLIDGEFGGLQIGMQVAVGFNEDVHAPRGTALTPDAGARLWIGQDGGLTPTSVIGQRLGPRVQVLASLSTEHGGIRQHVELLLRPWLEEHTPFALTGPDRLVVMYDPSMGTDDPGDSEQSPLRVMRKLLPAHYRPGPVNWSRKAPNRKDPLLAVLNAMVGGTPVLAIDPVQARGLVRALRGGWHYPTDMRGGRTSEDPVKDHPDSDYGDAFAYLIAGMAPSTTPRPPMGQLQATTGASDPYGDRQREQAQRTAQLGRWS